MKAAAGTMDGIIDTVSAGHQIVPLLDLLAPMGQIGVNDTVSHITCSICALKSHYL
jgi:hypothetical protein